MFAVKDKFKRGYLKRGGVRYCKFLSNAEIYSTKLTALYKNEILVEVEISKETGHPREKKNHANK